MPETRPASLADLVVGLERKHPFLTPRERDQHAAPAVERQRPGGDFGHLDSLPRSRPCDSGRGQRRLAPCDRSSRWTALAGTSRGCRPSVAASAAQTPAACPVAMEIGITR
jgi:hypothetical protein